jgi:hypothetical protein
MNACSDAASSNGYLLLVPLILMRQSAAEAMILNSPDVLILLKAAESMPTATDFSGSTDSRCQWVVFMPSPESEGTHPQVSMHDAPHLLQRIQNIILALLGDQ